MNKKRIIIIATLAGLMGSAVAVEASGMFQKVSGLVRHDIAVKVNGQWTSMKPIYINGQAYLPAKSEAAALGYEVYYNAKDKSLYITPKDKGNGSEEQNLLLQSGIIQGVTRLDNGTYQLDVVGKGTNSWIKLNVDKTTKLIDGNGRTVDTRNLKAGTEIIAEYGPTITTDFPGQSHAVKITVGSEHLIKEDVIQSVKYTEDGWQVAFGDTKYGNTTTSLIVNAGKETSLLDKSGQPIAWESLKAGMKVRAYYGPMMTKSIPPTSPLYYLVVLGEPTQTGTLSPAEVSQFQTLSWSKLTDAQKKQLKTKKEAATVEVISASQSGVLATTDEAKKLLKDAIDKGGKLVTVTYQTDQDELLGPLTSVFVLDSKAFIGFNIRR